MFVCLFIFRRKGCRSYKKKTKYIFLCKTFAKEKYEKIVLYRTRELKRANSHLQINKEILMRVGIKVIDNKKNEIPKILSNYDNN